MTQGGLISVSEAQHEELMTGGDAFGTPGIVEDVTEYVTFGGDRQAAEDTVEQAQGSETPAADEQGGTTNDGSSSDSGTNKKALAAIGAVAIGAVALGGSQ